MQYIRNKARIFDVNFSNTPLVAMTNVPETNDAPLMETTMRNKPRHI